MDLLSASLLVAVFATSYVSGVLSLAGGTILIAIFAWILPVPVTMMLHGVTQTASNGSRAIIYWRHLRWDIVGRYMAGAAVCLAVFAWLTFVPDKTLLFFLLGIMPFVNFLVPKGYALDIVRPSNSYVCGFINSATQLTAGVSGPLLDIFFVRTSLTRFEIHATKGLTQTLGHIMKIIYFAVILGFFEEAFVQLPAWLYIAVIPTAYLGNLAARQVVQKMSDSFFKGLTQYFAMGMGVIFLIKAFSLLLENP